VRGTPSFLFNCIAFLPRRKAIIITSYFSG
jgi:hypothetical protein